MLTGSTTAAIQDKGDSVLSTVKPRHYVPILDGLRAVSIGLVLLAHSLIHRNIPTFLYNSVERGGKTGVAIFFVISGYLITTLLLREEQKNGRIDLKQFYVRRALRILPAAYVYLAVLALLAALGVVTDNPPRSFLAAILYVRNLVGTGYETGNLWSLSLEEQFYFFWPILVVLVPDRLRFRVTCVMIGVILAWRTWVTFNTTINIEIISSRSDLRMDTILVGCALALFRWNHGDSISPSAWFSSSFVPWLAIVGLCLWLSSASWFPHWFALGPTGVALGIAVLLNWVLEHTSSIVCRWLCRPPVLFVGRLSYSLYLWQQLFLAPPSPALDAVRWFPMNFFLSFAAALISFEFVEKPFLLLKDRFYRS